MALKPVGSGVSFAISGTAAASAFISHQSEYLRVYSPDKDAHVAVGTNPTAGTGDLVMQVVPLEQKLFQLEDLLRKEFQV